MSEISLNVEQTAPQPDQPAALLSSWTPSRRVIAVIGADLLLFGIAALVFVAIRDRWPEAFREGRRYLDANLASVGTALLAGSVLTTAAALWCAHRGRRTALVVLLGLSLLGGIGFVATKGIEYDTRWRRGLYWSVRQKPTKKEMLAMRQVNAARLSAATAGTAARSSAPDAARGKTLYAGTCASCHGDDALGLPRLGVALVANKFTASQDDAALLNFVKTGRGPTDPANTTGVAMPPRGGNPMLGDEKLADIVAYLRELQKQPAPAAVQAGAAVAATAPAAPAKLVIHRAVAPPAAEGPEGLAPTVRRATFTSIINQRQARLDTFFAVYLALTGLHGLHVVAGLAVLAWLLVRALRGRYTGQDSLPVNLGGFYWIAAGVAWLVLFPLVY